MRNHLKPKIAILVLCAAGFVSFLLSVTHAQETGNRTSQSGGTDPAKGEGKPTVEYLNRNGPSKGPFSEAVRVGNLLILSGKIGTDRSGKLVSGGIKAETKQTMENIRAALEAYGSSLDDVVKCTVMLADMSKWQDMNEVYRGYFKPERLPARSALGASGLALGAQVEIEAWAVVKNP